MRLRSASWSDVTCPYKHPRANKRREPSPDTPARAVRAPRANRKFTEVEPAVPCGLVCEQHPGTAKPEQRTRDCAFHLKTNPATSESQSLSKIKISPRALSPPSRLANPSPPPSQIMQAQKPDPTLPCRESGLPSHTPSKVHPLKELPAETLHSRKKFQLNNVRQNTMTETYVLDLARKLKAAQISYRMQITLAYAFLAYTKDQPEEDVGDYWIDLARKVISDDMKTRSALFRLSQDPAKHKDSE